MNVLGFKEMRRRKVKIFICKHENGFFVDSDDLPELNVFVENEHDLVNAIPQAIKYLFKHNENAEVRVLMEVPVFSDDYSIPERIVELEDIKKVA